MRLVVAGLTSGLMRGVCSCVLRKPVRLPVRVMMCWTVLQPVRGLVCRLLWQPSVAMAQCLSASILTGILIVLFCEVVSDLERLRQVG